MFRKAWLPTLLLLILPGILWLTRPSETSMVEHFASQIEHEVAAHVAQCEHCNDDPDHAEVVAGIRKRMAASGLKYRSFIFFSVLTEHGITGTQAVGILGMTISGSGPGHICPEDRDVLEGNIKLEVDFPSESIVWFKVHADGTCHSNGKQMTEQELGEFLLEQKEAGRVNLFIYSEFETKEQDIDRFAKIASGIEFDFSRIVRSN